MRYVFNFKDIGFFGGMKSTLDGMYIRVIGILRAAIKNGLNMT